MDLMEMELTAQVRILLKGGNVTPLHYFIVWIQYVKDSIYIPSLHADIDECELRIDNCHVNATCADVIGSFVCTCNNGFDGNGVDCAGTKFMCIVSSRESLPLN